MTSLVNNLISTDISSLDPILQHIPDVEQYPTIIAQNAVNIAQTAQNAIHEIQTTVSSENTPNTIVKRDHRGFVYGKTPITSDSSNKLATTRFVNNIFTNLTNENLSDFVKQTQLNNLESQLNETQSQLNETQSQLTQLEPIITNLETQLETVLETKATIHSPDFTGDITFLDYSNGILRTNASGSITTGLISSSDISTNSITTDKISDGAITSSKIATAVLDSKANSIKFVDEHLSSVNDIQGSIKYVYSESKLYICILSGSVVTNTTGIWKYILTN